MAANRSSSFAGTPQPGQATVPSLTKEQAGGCEQAVEPLLGAFSSGALAILESVRE